ncbi:MAG: UDP-glucose--hexose-1-phosphate uridylyltransferase [Gammaproteobacteria bacterium]|nr:UDP-glucose--hexose-1-phosphate uridylyltransferase [Gammaproteobacteria bacterium]
MSNLEFTHRRRNQLTGDWVLVSPHRNNRPWKGAAEASAAAHTADHDPNCALCPGNTRANGEYNPDYAATFVFANDFGALIPTQSDSAEISAEEELFTAEVANGECRVICFSPVHSKTLPEMTQAEIGKVVDTWQQHYSELSASYNCVHIFENKGEIMGCSQPHPHGQVWAHDHWSSEIAAEDRSQQLYFDKHQSALLADYVDREIAEQVRVVIDSAHWLVVVPFWAAWPFETLLLCKDPVPSMAALNAGQKDDLAGVIKELTTRYDNIFKCSFPYSMGWHSAPTNLDSDSHWRLHAHFYPPLLRSATVKKHMVGYEMLAESQRDLTAETAAKILRDVSDIHYKKG